MRRSQLILVLLLSTATSSAGLSEAPNERFTPPPGLNEGWYARIHTDKGMIIVRLLPDQAPQSVAHFAALAQGRMAWNDAVTGERLKIPYYDGVLVDHAEAGVIFEAGARHESGRRSPTMFAPPEGVGPVSFFNSYRLGMAAVAGDRSSAVRFFVTASALPRFIGKRPCFGEVVEGKEVVFNITTVKTHRNTQPIEPLVIHRIRIFKVGAPPPLPEPKPYWPEPQRPLGQKPIRETPPAR